MSRLEYDYKSLGSEEGRNRAKDVYNNHLDEFKKAEQEKWAQYVKAYSDDELLDILGHSISSKEAYVAIVVLSNLTTSLGVWVTLASVVAITSV